jgi:hypothetical protein
MISSPDLKSHGLGDCNMGEAVGQVARLRRCGFMLFFVVAVAASGESGEPSPGLGAMAPLAASPRSLSPDPRAISPASGRSCQELWLSPGLLVPGGSRASVGACHEAVPACDRRETQPPMSAVRRSFLPRRASSSPGSWRVQRIPAFGPARARLLRSLVKRG